MAYVTKALAEILGIPLNATSATVFLRPGRPPIVRATFVDIRPGGEVERTTKRFRLVEIERGSNAGE